MTRAVTPISTIPAAEHIWRIPREQSVLHRLLGYLLILIAFSLPLEGLLQRVVETDRSLAFYLTVVAAGLGFLRLLPLLNELRRATGLLLLIGVYVWLALLNVANNSRSTSEIVLMVQLLIMAVLFVSWADDSKMRDRFVWAYWWGWFTLTVLSTYVLFSGDVNLVRNYGAGYIRADEVLGYSTNQHAIQVGCGIVLTWVLLMRSKRLPTTLLLIASVVLSAVPLLATASHTGTIGIFIVLSIWFGTQIVLFARLRRSMVAGFVVLMVFFGIQQLIANSPLGASLFASYTARIERMVSREDFSRRDVLFLQGLAAAERNLLGVGQGNSLDALAAINGGLRIDPHNYYLRILIEGGIPGLIVFTTAIFLVLRSGWRYYRQTGKPDFFWPLLYLLVVAVAGRSFHYKILWFFLVLNVITPQVTSQDTAAES